jgi:hypothetical protein
MNEDDNVEDVKDDTDDVVEEKQQKKRRRKLVENQVTSMCPPGPYICL